MPTDIILAVFASGGFWAFVQFLISRRDKTQQRLDEINDKMNKLSDKIDHNAAVLARTHILRFDDELLNGVKHSKEYFRQQLDDIDTYDEFCDKHPKFQNSYPRKCTPADLPSVFSDMRTDQGRYSGLYNTAFYTA